MNPEPPSEGIVEDHFPVPNEVPIDTVIVDGDVKSIHEKLNNYEQLDTEER